MWRSIVLIGLLAASFPAVGHCQADVEAGQTQPAPGAEVWGITARDLSGLGAVALLGRAHMESRFGEVERAAEQGDVVAMTLVGLAYSYGVGVAHDDARSLQWLRLAADRGNARAMGAVAYVLNGGDKFTADKEPALQEYLKAAKLGNGLAAFNLGAMYDRGTVVSKDPAVSAGWYLKAAIEGYVGGQRELGRDYATGSGVEQSDEKAVFWLQKAADQNDAAASYEVGRLYAAGRGTPRDDGRAMVNYRRGAQLGSAAAKVALTAYVPGSAGDCPGDATRNEAAIDDKAASLAQYKVREDLDLARGAMGAGAGLMGFGNRATFAESEWRSVAEETSDAIVQRLARTRLAAVLVDDGKFEEADRLLIDLIAAPETEVALRGRADLTLAQLRHYQDRSAEVSAALNAAQACFTSAQDGPGQADVLAARIALLVGEQRARAIERGLTFQPKSIALDESLAQAMLDKGNPEAAWTWIGLAFAGQDFHDQFDPISARWARALAIKADIQVQLVDSQLPPRDGTAMLETPRGGPEQAEKSYSQALSGMAWSFHDPNLQSAQIKYAYSKFLESRTDYHMPREHNQNLHAAIQLKRDAIKTFTAILGPSNTLTAALVKAGPGISGQPVSLEYWLQYVGQPLSDFDAPDSLVLGSRLQAVFDGIDAQTRQSDVENGVCLTDFPDDGGTGGESSEVVPLKLTRFTGDRYEVHLPCEGPFQVHTHPSRAAAVPSPGDFTLLGNSNLEAFAVSHPADGMAVIVLAFGREPVTPEMQKYYDRQEKAAGLRPALARVVTGDTDYVVAQDTEKELLQRNLGQGALIIEATNIYREVTRNAAGEHESKEFYLLWLWSECKLHRVACYIRNSGSPVFHKLPERLAILDKLSPEQTQFFWVYTYTAQSWLRGEDPSADAYSAPADWRFSPLWVKDAKLSPTLESFNDHRPVGFFMGKWNLDAWGGSRIAIGGNLFRTYELLASPLPESQYQGCVRIGDKVAMADESAASGAPASAGFSPMTSGSFKVTCWPRKANSAPNLTFVQALSDRVLTTTQVVSGQATQGSKTMICTSGGCDSATMWPIP